MSFEGFDAERSYPAFGQFLGAFEGFCGPSWTDADVVFIQAGDEWGGEEGAQVGWKGEGFVKDGVEVDGDSWFQFSGFLGWGKVGQGGKVSCNREGCATAAGFWRGWRGGSGLTV
jgi:hypothetical protein